MSITILVPTHESAMEAFTAAPRPDALVGATIGFVSNGKEGTRGFFDHLERMLRDERGVAAVVRRTKPNYSAPAPAPLVAEAGAWDLAVTGLGD